MNPTTEAYLEQIPARVEVLGEALLLLPLARTLERANGERKVAEVGVDLQQPLPVLVVELVEPASTHTHAHTSEFTEASNKPR
jgi:hypothetical protein